MKIFLSKIINIFGPNLNENSPKFTQKYFLILLEKKANLVNICKNDFIIIIFSYVSIWLSAYPKDKKMLLIASSLSLKLLKINITYCKC